MIDRAFVGATSDPYRVRIERGDVRAFAEAIGERDPVYHDPAAARAAGHPDLPVPPTYPFSVELARPAPFEMLERMGVPLARVLHGEQSFRYLRPLHAGETVTVRGTILDIRSAKGGALELIERETTIEDGEGRPAVVMGCTIVVRTAAS